VPPTLRPESPGKGEPRERERTVTETKIRPQGARIPRDKLLDLFSDWRYHSAHELSQVEGIAPGAWVTLVGELIEYGYGFGRRGNSLIMRERASSERPQDLTELLAGIDARRPEDQNPRALRDRAEQQVRHLQGMGPPPEERHDVPVELAYQDEDERGPSLEAPDDPSLDFDVEADTHPQPAEGDRLRLSADPRGCVLPARATVTGTFAILAKKKSGKTYLAMAMAEEFLRHNLPFIAIDPTGVWYGLRALANAKPSPWNVLTLGGRRGVGDAKGPFELNPERGAYVADLVESLWPRAVVLDLSEMVPEDQHRFVADFGTRIFVVNRRPVHIFMDEADEFVPQTPDQTYRHQRRCLNAVDRIVRRGRVKGLGWTGITQRPAVINKNALSQIDGMMVLHLVAPHDLQAIDDWLKPLVPGGSERHACLSSLPTLGKGEAFFMQNGSGKIPLIRFVVRPKETFDSSRTPSMDDPNPPEPTLVEPVAEDVEKVRRCLGLVSEDSDGDGETS